MVVVGTTDDVKSGELDKPFDDCVGSDFEMGLLDFTDPFETE